MNASNCSSSAGAAKSSHQSPRSNLRRDACECFATWPVDQEAAHRFGTAEKKWARFLIYGLFEPTITHQASAQRSGLERLSLVTPVPLAGRELTQFLVEEVDHFRLPEVALLQGGQQ